MSRIIATQGPDRLLLDCEYETDGKPQGQVIDTRRGRIFPPKFIMSIVARGYWDPVEMDDDSRDRILASVRGSAHVSAAWSGRVISDEVPAPPPRLEG